MGLVRLPAGHDDDGRATGSGLSEITVVDRDTLAVIERDKLNGPDAKVKAVYTVQIPTTDPAPGTVGTLTKTLAATCVPALRATNGWTQEKLEGLTIGGDGQVYAVTDNDGLKDATGETVLLRLGDASKVFTDGPREVTAAGDHGGVSNPYSVMVVCTGNICRSPMAEIVLRERFAAAGLADQVVVDSTGISDEEHGNPVDRRARAVLVAHGYPAGDGHRARQVAADDRRDLVLAMTNAHARALRRPGPGAVPVLRPGRGPATSTSPTPGTAARGTSRSASRRSRRPPTASSTTSATIWGMRGHARTVDRGMSLDEIPLTTLHGDATTFGEYADQVKLVVNVASRCGLAPQYEKLEELQKTYGDRGFTVLGFPSNQFLQELGSEEAIAEYCSTTWGVTFPMFEKTKVNGRSPAPALRGAHQDAGRVGQGRPGHVELREVRRHARRVGAPVPPDHRAGRPGDRRGHRGGPARPRASGCGGTRGRGTTQTTPMPASTTQKPNGECMAGR